MNASKLAGAVTDRRTPSARRWFVANHGRGYLLLVLAGLPAMLFPPVQAQAGESAVVYQGPECDCCDEWVGHLRGKGFDVSVRETREMAAVKTRLGVPFSMTSCHSAVISGYVIEGHVPAAAIRRLLKERRRIAGLTVPGMPAGSPGMEGTRSDPYEILAFDRLGVVTVYETVRPAFVGG